MATQITLRRDTYANWTSVNPVLGEGEIGLVTNFADNNTRIKIGDGATAWEDLDYFTTSQDLSNYVTDAELASALSNYVPTSRTVNGKALSSNISIDKTDVGLGSVDNTSDANKPISIATQTALDLKQDEAIVISSNTTAVNDAVYHNVATATYTDPSPVEGKGFTVFVRNGTATIGGTAYSTVGTIVKRTFHSGAWNNEVYTVDSVGTIAPVNTPIADNDSINTFASKTQGQINNLVPQSRTLTINGTAYDLSSNRSWTVGDVTTGSDASLASLTITGTAGAGFLSLINQSSAPSAVNGTVRLFANSSSSLTWVRRNNANSSDIRRTLIMPDQDIDYTFPTPATGSSSTLAGLNTVQTWTQQQTFNGSHRIQSLEILDADGTNWRRAIVSTTTGQLRIGDGFTGNPFKILLEGGVSVNGNLFTSTIGTVSGGAISIGLGTDDLNISLRTVSAALSKYGTRWRTGDNGGTVAGANTKNISYLSGNITNASALSSSSTGSHLFEVGTVAGLAVRGGVSFFNGLSGSDAVEPNWQGGQRIMFIGNRTSAPTGNPSSGYYNYASSGNPVFRTSGGAIVTLTTTTGWGTPTGTLTRTTFDTTTVTLSELAERVAALISDLKTVNGLLST